MSSRLQHTTKLYRDYGDAGLARAREIYSNPIDRQVVDSLRGLHKAGVFPLNDFSQNRAAITILALNGAEALRPCASGDAPETTF